MLGLPISLERTEVFLRPPSIAGTQPKINWGLRTLPYKCTYIEGFIFSSGSLNRKITVLFQQDSQTIKTFALPSVAAQVKISDCPHLWSQDSCHLSYGRPNKVTMSKSLCKWIDLSTRFFHWQTYTCTYDTALGFRSNLYVHQLK